MIFSPGTHRSLGKKSPYRSWRRSSPGLTPTLLALILSSSCRNSCCNISRGRRRPKTGSAKVKQRSNRPGQGEAAVPVTAGKAWRQLRAPPPSLWVRTSSRQVYEPAGPLSLHRKTGSQLPRSLTRSLPNSKSADAGGWTTETAEPPPPQSSLSGKFAVDARPSPQTSPPLGPVLRAPGSSLVCLAKGGGAIRPIPKGMRSSRVVACLDLKNAFGAIERHMPGGSPRTLPA